MEVEMVFDKKTIKSKLKDGIFSVFDNLLDNNNISLVGFVIYHIIEFFQMIYFNFFDMFSVYWKNKGIYSTIKSFLEYFSIIRIVQNNFNYYILVFYLFMVLNTLIALNFLYILVCLRKNFNIWAVSKMFLRFMSNIYNSVLMIPMLTTFTMIFNCTNTNNSLVNSHFSTINCFQGNYIVHFMFSIIGIVFSCGYGLLITLIFVDTSKSKNIKARFANSYESVCFVSKIVLVFLFEYSNLWGSSSLWICDLINFLLVFISFTLLMKEKPYFNTKIQKVLTLFSTLLIFTSSILTISMTLPDQYTGIFELFFIGSLFIIVLLSVYLVKKHEIIIIPNVNIREEHIILKKIFYILELVDNQDIQENELFLKGFIMIHQNDECKFNTNLINLQSKDEDYKLGNNKMKKNEEEYAAFVKYIDELFKNAISKFPNSNMIKLYYILFSINYLKNHVITTSILKKIENNKPTFSEEFIVYRYSRIIEEKLMIYNKVSQNIDINLEISYKRIKNIFTNLMEQTAESLLEFWDIISREERNLLKIEKLIFKINENLENISLSWKDVQKLKNNEIKIKSIYKKFLKYVLNDEQSGEDLINNQNQPENNFKKVPILGEYSEYIQDGSAYIYASASPETIGKIISANSSACRLFGYTLESFLRLNINDLMPELFREEHEKKIIDMSKREKTRCERDLRRIYTVGINRSGYIFPLNLTLLITSTANSVNLLAFLRPPHLEFFKNYHCFFLTDNDLKLKNVSSQAITIFGINNTNFFLKRKNMKMIEYLDLCELIQDLKKIKEDTNNINEFKFSNGINSKKKIIIENFETVKSFIKECGETNKTIKIEETEEKLIKKGMKNDQDNNNYNIDQKKFKEFFITIQEIKIMDKSLGYIIELEPTKEDEYMYENPMIQYDPNIFHFHRKLWKFFDPNIIEKEDKSKLMTYRSEIYDSASNRKDDGDIVDYFIKDNKIENYSKFIICKCINLPSKFVFKVVDEKQMKITETLKNINEFVKNRQDIKEIEIENEGEESSMIDKSTEDFLNFKGIEGWQTIINKIKKNKIPIEIKILKFSIILVGMIKFVLMILYYMYIIKSYDHLTSLNQIQNYTQYHTHYMIESITLSEKIYKYRNGYTSNLTEFKSNVQNLTQKINTILDITNTIKQYQIQDDSVNNIFLSNYTFNLIDNVGRNQGIQMNLLEIFMQLINKLISFVNYYDNQTKIQNEEDYKIFFMNSMNIYINTIKFTISTINDIFLNSLNDCSKLSKNILLISLSLLAFALINTLYIVKIKNIKHQTIDLFFCIPQKFCWKYYSNCELFLRFQKNDDENLEMEDQYSNDSESNYEIESDKKKMIVNNRKYQRKVQVINYSMIINVVLLNLVYFLFVISFYGFNLMSLNMSSNQLSIMENLNYRSFSSEVMIQTFVINQRQIYNQTGYNIMFTSNAALQDILYKNLSIENDLVKEIIIKNEENIPSGFLTSILNSTIQGLCPNNNISLYMNICSVIPIGYYGLDKLNKYLILELTSIYLNYTNLSVADKSANNILLQSTFINLNSIIDNYISPILNDNQNQIVLYVNSNLSLLSAILLTLLIIYSIFLVIIFIFYLVLYQNKIVVEIIYTKSTLLLIHPNDIKEIKPIMNFLHREIYMLNTQ